MPTVKLVTSIARLERDFPGQVTRSGGGLGMLSADYPVTPSDCRTALGRWLASTISSTRFDADASRLDILINATEEGLHFRSMGERLMRAQSLAGTTEAEMVFREMEQWISTRRGFQKCYGATCFRYRVIQYQWPVYGSARAEGADTPAQYFDLCAGQVRGTGGVILRAGLRSDVPSDSLTASMARGQGALLLAKYRRAQA